MIKRILSSDVHSADSVKRCIPMKFVESKKPREVDTPEKVSGGDIYSFYRGVPLTRLRQGHGV